MPYVVCSRCHARSYVLAGHAESCPVCDGSLPLARPARARDGRPLRDGELVARHREGDAEAFGALHERHAGALRGLALRFVGAVQAEDVVQEAFERAHWFMLGDPRALSTDFALGAWLRAVVRNRCVDDLRRNVAMVALGDEAAAAAALGPHERAVLAEDMRRLSAGVRALPARQREALVGHVLNGEPHDELARRLDVSVQATKSLVNRARCELRHSAAAWRH